MSDCWRQKNRISSAGFTLIELMVVIVVLVLLITIGIPSFREIIQNNRAATLSSHFISAVHYTRSEAIRRGAPVTLCPASNASQTACGAAGNWDNGWIVFSDPNSDGVIASANDRLRVWDALEGNSTVTTSQGRLTFAGTGFATAGAGNGAAGQYTLSAEDCSGNHARIVSITSTGRTTVTAGACS